MKPALAGDQLTITGGGASFQLVLRKVLFEPFVKTTGIKISEDEYDYGLTKIRAMVASKSVSWNAVYATESGVRQLCAEGIIEIIDWKKLGLDRAKLEGANYADCGVPANVSATVVAYDKAKLPKGPTTIAGLFDLQKFRGKRGLYKSPASNLEWALIVDGVPTRDVYKIRRAPEGVDRAFKKLDTIKKDIIC